MNFECSGESTVELKFQYRRSTSFEVKKELIWYTAFENKCYLLKGREKKGVTEQNRYPAEKNIQMQKCQTIEQ